MTRSDLLLHKAVGLASSGVALDRAREELLRAAGRDRLALEIAHASVLRDGLPRVRTSRRGNGSLRNRTLNLLEFALAGASENARRSAQPAYAWNQVAFDSWD